jgi:hypothetical protein
VVSGPGSDIGSGSDIPGGSVGLQGRGDAANRMNLFDNMSAYPVNRLWFALQFLDNFQPGVNPNPITSPVNSLAFGTRRDEQLYRMGGEVVIGDDFSLSFQAQYIGSSRITDGSDAWGPPQLALKYTFINCPCCAAAALFAVQPEVSTSSGEVHERTTRLAPGFLFYSEINDRWFCQGGGEFVFATQALPITVDYAFSLGYWLIKNPCCNPCVYVGKPIIVGVASQLEFYGKHVLRNSSNDPFNVVDPTTGSPEPYREARNVFDVTWGLRVLMFDHWVLGGGVSFPVSGPRVRDFEAQATVNFLF